MFIHAHPDDEIYFKAGWLYDRIQSIDTVYVVIVTAGDANKWTYPNWEASVDAKDFDGDGDIDMVDRGYDRMAYRSTPGLASMGLKTETNLIFLGYPDGGIYDMWENRDSQYLNPLTNANSSPYKFDAPKYCYGLGYKDEVPYTYESLSQDIRKILTIYRPDCLMVPDFLDTPSDHGALGRVATQALYDLKIQGDNDWVSHVEVIWSFPSHFVWDNPESWIGGKNYLPNDEGPFLIEPFPQDIFPPQVKYYDNFGSDRKCGLWNFHPYEMPDPPCFRARKNDMFRGPFVMYDDTKPIFFSDSLMTKEVNNCFEISVSVQDKIPGLNTEATPQYIYSTDNGKNWEGTKGLMGCYRNKNNKTIYHYKNYKNRPETENYSYWQGHIALQRVDEEINFENNFGIEGLINKEYWSAEWIGWIKTSEESGFYSFYLDAEDSGFLNVNNELLVWDHQDFKMGNERGMSIYLEKEKVYPIHLGFYNYKDSAGCKLFWKQPNSEKVEIIPSSNLLCGNAQIDSEIGSSSIQTIKAKSILIKNSSTENKILFMVLDMAGNIGVSSALNFK